MCEARWKPAWPTRKPRPRVSDDLPYVVYCGSNNVVIGRVTYEHIAIVIATDHETVHRCGAYWERPFDHVAFLAPNAHDG